MKRVVEEIVDKYAEVLYRIAYVKLKSKVDAEDIVQDVFIKYMLTNKEFQSEEHEKSWLIRVTLNLCKNLILSAWKRHNVPIDEECLNIITEEKEKITDELNNLKESSKKVIQLFYFEDLSVENIGKILNITETNVRTRLKRARKELKDEIEKSKKLYEKV